MSSSQYGCDTDWGCCQTQQAEGTPTPGTSDSIVWVFAEEQHEKHYSQLAVLLSAEDYKDEFSSSTGSGG